MPHMATHNRLLGLGDLYLEVIAADPGRPAPGLAALVRSGPLFRRATADQLDRRL